MRQVSLLLALLLSACAPIVDDVIQPSIDELRNGRPAIINFWASWCSFCKDELPLFEEVHQKYSGIATIGVNMQESSTVADSYWSAGGYTFPSLLDPNKILFQQFGIFTQPTTFILDANGKEIYRKDGPLTENELDEQLRILEAMYGNLESVSVEQLNPSMKLRTGNETVSDVFQLSSVPSNLQAWYSGNVEHSIPLDEILGGGPAKDGIPALENPEFTSTEEANYLSDNDIGLLLQIEEDVRYYPFAILNWHEIANDVVGGKTITVTYCPLCDTAVIFSRETTRGITTFGVSGKLYQSNLLMYDRETESLWNQLKGEAVVGPLTGEILERIPSDVVQWSTVKDRWPDAKVLSVNTGYSRDYSRDPYSGYADSDDTIFPVAHLDDRIFSKTRVLGIVINGEAKAYVVKGIIEVQNIEDTVGGKAVSISLDEKTGQITFTADGEEIVPMPSFWFSWVAQYPETLLH